MEKPSETTLSEHHIGDTSGSRVSSTRTAAPGTHDTSARTGATELLSRGGRSEMQSPAGITRLSPSDNTGVVHRELLARESSVAHPPSSEFSGVRYSSSNRGAFTGFGPHIQDSWHELKFLLRSWWQEVV